MVLAEFAIEYSFLPNISGTVNVILKNRLNKLFNAALFFDRQIKSFVKRVNVKL